jgi:hypothetical protein
VSNRWSFLLWALVVGIVGAYMRGSVTPVTIVVVAAIAVAAFGVGYALDRFSASRKQEEPAPPSPVATTSPQTSTEGSTPSTAVSAEPMNLPPIPLDPNSVPKPATSATTTKKDTEEKDSVRELIETIVFVVVLVLMLKTFLAEAFVIPTGSMADTLLGYHYKEVCADCRYPNLINASAEAEPQGGRPVRITGYKCTNCGHINTIQERRGGRP